MIRNNLGGNASAQHNDFEDQAKTGEKYRSRGENRAAALVQGVTGKLGLKRQASVGAEDIRGIKGGFSKDATPEQIFSQTIKQ